MPDRVKDHIGTLSILDGARVALARVVRELVTVWSLNLSDVAKGSCDSTIVGALDAIATLGNVSGGVRKLNRLHTVKKVQAVSGLQIWMEATGVSLCSLCESSSKRIST